MTATLGSAARDVFARALETARRRLRETIETHPDTLPDGVRSSRGAFPGMLWILAEHDPDAAWWRDQAIRYSKLAAALKDDPDPAGLGFVFLPSCCRWAEATGDPAAEEAIVHAGRLLLLRLKADEPCPTVESLIDAILVFHAAAISDESDMRGIATAHCLAARRLLVRGDGSLAGDQSSPQDLAWAIYGFGGAYRFTRDPRFLATAENCAACLLENLPGDAAADVIAAAALLQLSTLTTDTAKSRLYSLLGRHVLVTLAGAGDYIYLDSTAAGNGVPHALVAPKPQPEPEPEPPPQTPEEPGRKTLRPLAFLLAPIVFFLLVEILVFRSNFYLRFVEPESAAGTFEGVIDHENTRPRHAKEVFVLGSSRIAEGFSSKRVNQGLGKDDLWFVNGAVAGAGPRCMYYFLRDVDPHRDRYQAIVMTIDDYDDHDDLEDFSDRTADLYEIIARLRFIDVLPFVRSFPSSKSRWEVLKGSLVKSIVYQRDIQELLDHPGDRMDKVKLFREHRFGWAEDYFGANNSLAGTTVDWATNTVTFPPTIPKSDQDYLRPRLITKAPQTGKTRAFQVKWLGAFADLYRNSKTRIVFIQPPRCPFPSPTPLAHFDWTTVDDLRKRPWVTVVDPHTFAGLEKPELFADHVHLNGEGNKLFSPALVATLKAILQK